MKNTYASAKMYLLVTLILSSSLYPKPIGERIYDNKTAIGCAFLVAGAAAIGCFGIPYGIKKYHENVMLQERTRLAQHNQINDTIASDVTVTAQLAANKTELINKWKTTQQHGLSISGSQSFSGRYYVANALSLNFSTSGTGILSNCISTNSTELSGDVIANSCLFNGDVTINEPTSFASFNNCLLGNVRYHGTPKSIIELRDTIVDGSITFDKPGIIVVNNNSIISGSIINGRIIRS
jgi:hypothetical protein